MCIEVFSIKPKLSEEYTYGCTGEGRTVFMEKKTASAIMLALLLTSLLALAFNIQPAKASGTIYIRADGSIDPPTAPISTVDNITYTFTDNIYDSIVVERDNIIVDGAGYTVQGTGSGSGISLSERTNVTIRNMEIKAFRIGIYFDNSSKNCISGSNIRENSQGVYVYGGNLPPETESCYNGIVGNNITENGGGILLEEAKLNNVSGNNITANHGNVDYPLRPGGIYIFLNSLGNIVSGNNIINNERYGIYFHYCTTLTPELFNVVRGNNIINNGAGIETYHGVGVGIFENNIKNNNVGLDLKPGLVTAYHNNFINNTQQVGSQYGLSGGNVWDDGYPSGGNYWSDYAGVDANGDGIGDTPYIIDADNQDRYPLMHLWSPLPVHNMNTGLGYATIQEAINANETLNGHTIFVEAGIYREHVSVNKTVHLIGEGRVVTIIDGYEVDVTANNVALSGFAIGGFTAFAEGKKGNGIRLEADGCTVDNNTIFNASPYAVWLLNSTNNVISNNVMVANDYNMRLDESSNNTISQNYIGSIEWEGGIRLVYGGIELYHSSNNTILQNNVTQCKWGIKIEGRMEQMAEGNRIIENNIQYVPYDGGGIELAYSINNTIARNEVTPLPWGGKEEATGISLRNSHKNSIINNNIRGNFEGIKLVDSALNNIAGNNLTGNFYGILLEGSQVNSLIRNNITHPPVIFEGSNETGVIGYGILIRLCYYGANTLRYNNVTGYRYNFGVEGYMDRYVQDVDDTNIVDGKPIYYWVNRKNGQIPSDAGYVAIVNSTNIIVEGLTLENNYQGIVIADSNNTIIRNNNITNNRYGIVFGPMVSGSWLDSSSNNTIYHNNLINNTNQVGFWAESLENVWDNGYPSGGNCWSDYAGVDVKSGLNQDLPESDGIGDTPYIIDADNQDRYPLMRPWTLMPTVYTFSIVWEEETFTASVESNSTVSNLAFNQPNKEISFYVTGPDGTIGFCNVTIPKALLWVETPDEWTLLIDGSLPIFLAITENATHNSLYFTYTHSTHEARIIGTHVIAPPPPPLSVSISPLSASILVDQSITFTSTVSGGYTPYAYQWYLNGAPVSGATSNTWTLTPATSGIYYVHLKVTDAKDNTAQSDAARITVASVPVGGYSVPMQVTTRAEPVLPYIALIAILTGIFTKLRPKTRARHKN
jgi:parallel beta-helix repeat protein